MCSDYGSYIKNYFIRAHKISSGKDYNFILVRQEIAHGEMEKRP